MKTSWAVAAACLALQAAAPSAQARPSSTAQAGQRAGIEQLLNKYEHALNTGDVNRCRAALHDGVFMAPESPTAIGTKVLRGAYASVFQAIALKLKFQIAEAKLLSPEWAMLRTTSSGTVKIVANGAEIPGSNQELFLLRKTGGQWKLARYSFSSVLPRAK